MSGDGVVAGTTKGIATQDALERQPTTFEGTIFLDSFYGVLRARGRIAARRRRKGRDAVAIELDHRQHYFCKDFAQLVS